jgi:hypothetical protein
MSSAASAGEQLVEREAVVALAPRRAQTATPEPVPQAFHAPSAVVPPPAPPQADRAFVGVLSAVTALLAARLLLLLAIVGAFVLAFAAQRAESYVGLAILVAFCCLTLIPMVYLDVVTHRRGGA